MADLYNHDLYARYIAEKAIEKWNQHIKRCNHAQMVTPTESEKTVRRIATMPNGCAQAAMNRTKPNHTGCAATELQNSAIPRGI